MTKTWFSVFNAVRAMVDALSQIKSIHIFHHETASVVGDKKIVAPDDILMFKNNCPSTGIVLADKGGKPKEIQKAKKEEGDERIRRATDLLEEVNINVISKNPVFLARVHLRNMSLPKVNQLLLDFDLTDVETQYIISFLNTMLKKVDQSEELKREEPMLLVLRESFKFYLNVILRNEKEITRIIESASDSRYLANYGTLLAKIKTQFPDTSDQLSLTNYENMIYEMKDKLKSK